MTDTAHEPMTAEQIRARLDEIAQPFPPGVPVTAAMLAKRVAVHAQRRNHRHLSTWFSVGASLGREEIESVNALCGEFAAVHLLTGLMAVSVAEADKLADQIAGAWDDGGGIGEWLWEHCQALGIDPEEINRLEDARLALEANPVAPENARQESGTNPTEGNI